MLLPAVSLRKKCVVLGVSEFAANFRYAIPEVRGKTEICRLGQGFTLSRPAVLLPKIGLRSAISDFSPPSGNRAF